MKLAAPLVTWQNGYALGLVEIDEQHKMLFDIMNRIWESIVRNDDATAIGSTLEDLERYTILHFTEEETFMRSIRYPNFDAHVALHRHFVQRIADEKAKAQRGERISLELLHFLRDWLVNHILVEDKRYVTQFHTEKHNRSLLGRFFARLGNKTA
ncbi:MAG: bacteriohemerythrin [Giesbergeria sp.]|jgi:hemerythrin-like metal-binding protein|nr:bacteriohemerythrin [Giesbergeria sp.]